MAFNRPYIRGQGAFVVDNDSSLVYCANMIPNGVTLPDQSGNGNDGTIGDNIIFGYDDLGTSLHFPDLDVGVTVPDNSTLDITEQITLSSWVNPTALDHVSGGNTARFINKTSSYFAYVNSSGSVVFGTSGVSDPSTISPEDSIVVGLWSFVVCTYNSITGIRRVYVNGALSAEETGLTGTIATSGSDVLLGQYQPTSRAWYGRIGQTKIFNVAKDATWVAEEYARGRQALFRTDAGAYTSTAPITGGCCENTPFRVSSGSYQVSDDTIDGTSVKVIECVTPGICYMPASFFSGSNKQNAYGDYEWWGYKGSTSNATGVLFCADTIGALTTTGQNGYEVRLTTIESLSIRKGLSGSASTPAQTASDFVPIQTWFKLRVQRVYSGSTYCYFNDTLITFSTGTNPVEDNDVTESEYFVLDFDAGDKIAYSDGTGGHSIRKILLP